MELDELRKLLVGVRWVDFYEPDYAPWHDNPKGAKTLRISNIPFLGVFGIYLNSPTVAVLHKSEFVVVRPLRLKDSGLMPCLKNYPELILPDRYEPIAGILDFARNNGDALGLVLEEAENEPLAIEPALA